MAVAGLLPGYPYVSVFSGIQCRPTRRRPRQSSIASRRILESNDGSLVRFGRTFDRLALDSSKFEAGTTEAEEDEGRERERCWRQGRGYNWAKETIAKGEEIKSEGKEKCWKLNNA